MGDKSWTSSKVGETAVSSMSAPLTIKIRQGHSDEMSSC